MPGTNAPLYAPRHADATEPRPQIPALYADADMTDYDGLVMLLDYGHPLPTGVALRITPAHPETWCEACGETGADALLDDPIDPDERNRQAFHLRCLATGDHRGIVPACYVEWTPLDVIAY